LKDQINIQYQDDPYQFMQDLYERVKNNPVSSQENIYLPTLLTFQNTWKLNRVYKKVILTKKTFIREKLIVLVHKNKYYVFDGLNFIL